MDAMTMQKPTDAHSEIEAVFAQLRKAHKNKDADAIANAYAPDAVIYDLAPPLGRRGVKRDEIAEWLATWDGPVEIDARDVDLTVEGDLAFLTAFNRMRGRQGDEEQDLWFRATTCLRRTDGRWRIVHDHTSVPFYMDGSYKAATDLKPGS
jgi:uncharacterized protein (TIGR02246 family)